MVGNVEAVPFVDQQFYLTFIRGGVSTSVAFIESRDGYLQPSSRLREECRLSPDLRTPIERWCISKNHPLTEELLREALDMQEDLS